MPPVYTEITLKEMEELLTPLGFLKVPMKDGTREVVFGKRVAADLTLRIYTSVAYGDISRDVGEDAIRICLVQRDKEGKITGVGKSRRVNRTQNWRLNLTKRLEDWDALLGPVCPRCQSRTRLRHGEYGDFWGCCSFPICRGMVPIK